MHIYIGTPREDAIVLSTDSKGIYIHTYTCIYVCIYECLCVYRYIYLSLYVCLSVYLYICIHIYMYRHIHALKQCSPEQTWSTLMFHLLCLTLVNVPFLPKARFL